MAYRDSFAELLSQAGKDMADYQVLASEFGGPHPDLEPAAEGYKPDRLVSCAQTLDEIGIGEHVKSYCPNARWIRYGWSVVADPMQVGGRGQRPGHLVAHVRVILLLDHQWILAAPDELLRFFQTQLEFLRHRCAHPDCNAEMHSLTVSRFLRSAAAMYEIFGSASEGNRFDSGQSFSGRTESVGSVRIEPDRPDDLGTAHCSIHRREADDRRTERSQEPARMCLTTLRCSTIDNVVTRVSTACLRWSMRRRNW